MTSSCEVDSLSSIPYPLSALFGWLTDPVRDLKKLTILPSQISLGSSLNCRLTLSTCLETAPGICVDWIRDSSSFMASWYCAVLAWFNFSIWIKCSAVHCFVTYPMFSTSLNTPLLNIRTSDIILIYNTLTFFQFHPYLPHHLDFAKSRGVIVPRGLLKFNYHYHPYQQQVNALRYTVTSYHLLLMKI